jgi:hypothetical protein
MAGRYAVRGAARPRAPQLRRAAETLRCRYRLSSSLLGDPRVDAKWKKARV